MMIQPPEPPKRVESNETPRRGEADLTTSAALLLLASSWCLLLFMERGTVAGAFVCLAILVSAWIVFKD